MKHVANCSGIWLVCLVVLGVGCASGPSEPDPVGEVDAFDDETADLDRLVSVEPALMSRLEGTEGLEEFDRMIGDEEFRPWSGRGLGRIGHDLIEAGMDAGVAEGDRPAWMAATTAPFAAMNTNLGTGLPIGAEAWPPGAHLRLLIPTGDGTRAPGDVEEALEELVADRECWSGCSLNVQIESFELDDHLMVDVLVADREVPAPVRADWSEMRAEAAGEVPRLRETPALSAFVDSEAPMAMYGRIAEFGELVAGLRALDARRGVLEQAGLAETTGAPDPVEVSGRRFESRAVLVGPEALSSSSEETTEEEPAEETGPLDSGELARWWFGVSRYSFEARHRIDHTAGYIEDFYVGRTTESEENWSEVRATPTAGAPDYRASETRRQLREPIDGEAIAELDVALDLGAAMVERGLPGWAVDDDGELEVEPVLEGLFDEPLAAVRALNGPSAVLQALFAEQFDGMAPAALRLRVYGPEIGDELNSDVDHPVAATARLVDDGTVVEQLSSRYAELGAAAATTDLNLRRIDDGTVEVSVTVGAGVDDLLTDQYAPVESTEMSVDGPALGRWRDEVEHPWIAAWTGLSEFESLEFGGEGWTAVEIDRSGVEMAARIEQGRSATSVNAGESFDGELSERAMDCLDVQAIESHDSPVTVADRLEPCERLGEISDREARRLRGEMLEANGHHAMRVGDESRAIEAFDEACERGRESACRVFDRLDFDDELQERIPEFGWVEAPPHGGDCAGGALVSIRPDGVEVDGRRLEGLDPMDDTAGEEFAARLEEVVVETELGGPEAIFAGVEEAIVSRPQSVVVAADPEVDAAVVIEVLEELVDSAATGPIEMAALQNGRSSPRRHRPEVSCVPLELSGSDVDDPLDIEITARGIDVSSETTAVEPMVRCPADGPAVCLRPDQAGVPPERWIGFEELPEAAREYDVRGLNRLLHTVDAWLLGNARPTVRVGPDVPWGAFLAVYDVAGRTDRPVGEFDDPILEREFVRFDILDPWRGEVETDRFFDREIGLEADQNEHIRRGMPGGKVLDVEVTTR